MQHRFEVEANEAVAQGPPHWKSRTIKTEIPNLQKVGFDGIWKRAPESLKPALIHR